jgi:CRISPR-associated endonuclease Csn1
MKEQQKKHYRLGIDMGSTSIGWCMLELDKKNNPCGVINLGVRIFPDGRDDKSKEPLSVARRTYRGMRRNLDRYLERRKQVLDFFDRNGFLPQEANARKQAFLKDPVKLRVAALDKQLPLSDIARAYIHLSKRRGFKSNRKLNSAERDTKLTEAINNLKENLKKYKARTLGEYLYLRNAEVKPDQQHKRRPTKFRYETVYDDEEKIFPTRDMVEHEFDLIWDTQAKDNPKLTDSLKQELKGIIFFQRPLKPQEVGKCTFEPGEKRCPKAYLLFQEFRIWQDINHMKLINTWDNTTRDLTKDERDTIFGLLSMKESITFKAIRKELLGKGVADEYRFNFETENKTKLQGNLTNAAFYKKNIPGVVWDDLIPQNQLKLVDIILDDSLSDEAARLLIMDMVYSAEVANELANISLQEGYCSLSVKALNKLLPYLREGHILADAQKLAGYAFGKYNGEVFEDGKLPYYGELLKTATLPLQRITHDKDADEHGKINNPTVHIALNQLRKIVNALSVRFGTPAEICLELAREVKLGQKQNDEIRKTIGKNTKENERLAELLSEMGINNNSENRLKYKLWEELSSDPLNRCCVYCGKQITIKGLYGSDIHIEHILPKSRTYDDSVGNKTISHLSCNNDKGEKSPFEAFGNNPGSYIWQAVCERANSLPANKRWRFHKDAMDKFKDESEVLSRMLNDTRYMSRVAAEYMQYVSGRTVVPVTGKLTEVLRRKWGMNQLLGDTDQKERTDHRHHAIDAFVIAMTDRATVKRYADAVKRSKDRFLDDLPLPYESFNHAELQTKLNSIMVSFKPDQVNPVKLRSRSQTAGGLMEETAYGYVGVDPNNPKYALYAIRKPVSGLSSKDIEAVHDPVLKDRLLKLAVTCSDDKVFKTKLAGWIASHNIKKVKLIIKNNPDTMIPVRDKNGRIYKYYASEENLCADIFYDMKSDKYKDKWQMEIVKSFDAHKPDYTPEWKRKSPWSKLIMRLYKNDTVVFTNNSGIREFRRVRKMTYGIIYLRELQIAKKQKGVEDIGEQFSAMQLQAKRACKAGVDIIGRYFDPLGVNHAGNRA